MHPFHVLYKPALPDDHRFVADFGGLPPDTLRIVIRSIPDSERGSLLSLALVNKSAYFLTRPRRVILTAMPEDHDLGWGTQAFGDALRLEHALHLVCDPESMLCAADKHALLCHWLDRGLQPRQAQRLLAAVIGLPMPEKADLLWRLLVTPLRGTDAFRYEEAWLCALKQASDCLPKGEKSGFALACRVAYWRQGHLHMSPLKDTAQHAANPALESGDVSEDGANPDLEPTRASLERAFRQVLSEVRTWQFPAVGMALSTLIGCFHWDLFKQHEEVIIDIIHSMADWPASQRLSLLEELTRIYATRDCGADFADCMVQELLALESVIEKSIGLPDAKRLTLLNMLYRAYRHHRHQHHMISSAETLAALSSMARRVGGRLLELMLAVPCDVQGIAVSKHDIGDMMESRYHWGSFDPQWQEGFKALCAANRKAHGVSYGNLKNLLNLLPFSDRDESADEARSMILALLETGDEVIGSDDEAATWRLFINVIGNESHPNVLRPNSSTKEAALDHVEALLARPNIMTHAAWVELMAISIGQLGDGEFQRAFIHDALSHAATMPQAPRAELLRRIVNTIRDAKPTRQSSVVEHVLPMAQRLAKRERAGLFPDLISLYMKASAENGDAGEWLRPIMQLLTDLPEQLVMHAIEKALECVAHSRPEPHAHALLLSALQAQAAQLSAQPQASLLLYLAFHIGQFDSPDGDFMLAKLQAQADALELPQANKTAWKLLYRAAAQHHEPYESLRRQHRQHIEAEVGTLPESLRGHVTHMLETIDTAPSLDKLRLHATAAGWQCAIL